MAADEEEGGSSREATAGDGSSRSRRKSSILDSSMNQRHQNVFVSGLFEEEQ